METFGSIIASTDPRERDIGRTVYRSTPEPSGATQAASPLGFKPAGPSITQNINNPSMFQAKTPGVPQDTKVLTRVTTPAEDAALQAQMAGGPKFALAPGAQTAAKSSYDSLYDAFSPYLGENTAAAIYLAPLVAIGLGLGALALYYGRQG